ncbi:capsid and scaffold protein [Lactobacillus phage 3-521]|uniref:Capsid and scaffold protein n=1 Tax=Lactobacillus phage 3-521 TaxID=2510943 RepID=A0A4Y5FEV5_9CAUD|nr:capsid and scaffold protein [Lactobacillus phage 3-521]QBJ03595.1 capsid and scaffold protein [Lactobacillus phage 3-521]
MKQLILVGNQKVKFQDTETIISLTLVSDGNTVTIDKNKTYSVKIKNGTGYVKSLDATPNTTNNMVTFSTSGFDGLPVDAYFIELWVIDTNGQTIYPSDSFIELDITANATGVEGQVLPAITMQEFEERFSTLQSDLEAKVSTLIGPTGATGNGISGVSTQYQLGTDGVNVPTGTWSDTPSTPTDTLPYMWTRNVTTYTDKSTHTSYNISAKGTQGNNFTIQGSTSSIAGLPSIGTDGEGYMVGTELYVWTNGKWNDIVNMKGVQGDQGIQGIQGVKGDTGTGIQSTSTDYELSSQGVEVPNTGWSTTIPVTTNDLPYLWTRVTITFTDSSQHVIYFTSNKGDKGDKGDTGEKGDTGANLAVKGAVDKATSLPSTGNSEGDAYLVGTDLYVYTSGAWKDCGPIVAENTVLYNADGSLNVNGTNFTYVQDLRNGKIQYNDGTKNVQVTPMDADKEASDILAARTYTDSSVSALSTNVDTKLSSKANTADLSTGLATKADDSKVVHDNHDNTITANGASYDLSKSGLAPISYWSSGSFNDLPLGTVFANSTVMTDGPDTIRVFTTTTFYSTQWGGRRVQIAIADSTNLMYFRVYEGVTWRSWTLLSDDSKVVHSTDMRKPASDVSGIDEVNALQTQVDNSAVGTNLAIGTNQEYSMGYGIPTTTWEDGYAYEKLPTTINNGEILPQDPGFWYTLTQGVTYTQTIWFETDANVKDLSAAQITWYTAAGHDFQPAIVQKLGQNSYKVVSTHTWPGKGDNNVRLFDIENLDSAFDFSTGTYLKFGKLKLEKGSVATDWCPNPEDKVNVADMRKPASDVAGIEEVNAKQDKIGYTPADDSKVAHLSGANNFDTLPTVNNTPLLTSDKLPDNIVKQGDVIGNINYAMYLASYPTTVGQLVVADGTVDSTKTKFITTTNSYPIPPNVTSMIWETPQINMPLLVGNVIAFYDNSGNFISANAYDATTSYQLINIPKNAYSFKISCGSNSLNSVKLFSGSSYIDSSPYPIVMGVRIKDKMAATTDDVTTAISTATANMVDSSKPTNFTDNVTFANTPKMSNGDPLITASQTGDVSKLLTKDKSNYVNAINELSSIVDRFYPVASQAIPTDNVSYSNQGLVYNYDPSNNTVIFRKNDPSYSINYDTSVVGTNFTENSGGAAPLGGIRIYFGFKAIHYINGTEGTLSDINYYVLDPTSTAKSGELGLLKGIPYYLTGENFTVGSNYTIDFSGNGMNLSTSGNNRISPKLIISNKGNGVLNITPYHGEDFKDDKSEGYWIYPYITKMVSYSVDTTAMKALPDGYSYDYVKDTNPSSTGNYLTAWGQGSYQYKFDLNNLGNGYSIDSMGSSITINVSIKGIDKSFPSGYSVFDGYKSSQFPSNAFTTYPGDNQDAVGISYINLLWKLSKEDIISGSSYTAYYQAISGTGNSAFYAIKLVINNDNTISIYAIAPFINDDSTTYDPSKSMSVSSRHSSFSSTSITAISIINNA